MVRTREHPRSLLRVLFLITLTLVPTVVLGSHRSRPKPKELAPWGHVGEQIHRSEVQGYQISYHLLSYSDHGDLLEQIQAGLPAHLRKGVRGTHHLMAFVLNPQGQMETKARVVYTVRASGGEEQQVTAPPMSGGYGGDLRLAQGHPYRVEVEIHVGRATLTDEFELTPR